MPLIKILVICLVAAVLILLLRERGAEASFLTAVAAGAVVLWTVLRMLLPAFSRLTALWEMGGLSEEKLTPVWKSLGIAYLTGFAADTCRDFGQSSLAAKAELAGRIAIFLLCLPMLAAVLETALRLIGS